MENMTIILGVVMFTVVVIGLVAIILVARSKLVSTGDVMITINDNPDQSIQVAAGGKLMNTSLTRESTCLLLAVAVVRVSSAGV